MDDNDRLEELSNGAWVLVKALLVGIAVTAGLGLVVFAAIAVVTVVNATLGGLYAFALAMCMLFGLGGAGAYVGSRLNS